MFLCGFPLFFLYFVPLVTEKVVLALKKLFRPVNGMWSTRSLVKIHNIQYQSLIPAFILWKIDSGIGSRTYHLFMLLPKFKMSHNWPLTKLQHLATCLNCILKMVLTCPVFVSPGQPFLLLLCSCIPVSWLPFTRGRTWQCNATPWTGKLHNCKWTIHK